jgi:hypothetical protein
MFLAEVVAVHVDDRYMDDKNAFHMDDIGMIAYEHGTYRELGDKLGTFGFAVRKKTAKDKTPSSKDKKSKPLQTAKNAKQKKDPSFAKANSEKSKKDKASKKALSGKNASKEKPKKGNRASNNKH